VFFGGGGILLAGPETIPPAVFFHRSSKAHARSRAISLWNLIL
jgi:hypothetical protein